MKKLTVLTLCFAMVLSTAACGSKPITAVDPSTQGTTAESAFAPTESVSAPEESGASSEASEANGDLESFLNQLVIIGPSEDMFYVGWTLTGGMLDGVEMNDTDVEQVLENYGGKLQFVFNEDETVNMIQGGGYLEGTFSVADDAYSMPMVFDNAGTQLSYVGIFVQMDNSMVLVLLPDDSGRNALYFTALDER